MEIRQIYSSVKGGIYIQEAESASSDLSCSGINTSGEVENCSFSNHDSLILDVLSANNLCFRNNTAFMRKAYEENLEKVTFYTNQDVIYPVSNTINQARGFVGFKSFLVSKASKVSRADLIGDGDRKVRDVTVSFEQDVNVEKPDTVRLKHSEASGREQLRDLRIYAKQVESARTGAMTHPGGKEEVVCYADI